MSHRILDADVVALLQQHSPYSYSRERNELLWEQIPPSLRLAHFTRQSIPTEYRSAFGYYHDKIGNIHLDVLPTSLQREMAFAIWKTIERGGVVAPAPLGLLARELGETCNRLRITGKPFESLMDRTPHEWSRELALTWTLRTGAISNQETFRTYTGQLFRACKLVWFAYDDGPWWRREVWDLRFDQRIPRRPHEPTEQAINWHRIEPRWLRDAAMWHAKVSLETNQIAWSTARLRSQALGRFGAFLLQKGIDTPELASDHKDIRPLMVDFLDELRTKPIVPGAPNHGKRRGQHAIWSSTTALKNLYRFLHDNREEAVRILGDNRWGRLSPEHLRLFRASDFSRVHGRPQYDERHLVSDTTLAKINANIHLIGEPLSSGGLGDPQAMRILLLLIATGRRVSEICMLDLHPIFPVLGSPNAGPDSVAKLRYQQTKIADGPDTIFVGPEVVAIIEEQRRWLVERMAGHGRADSVPRYLFVSFMSNRFGVSAYSSGRLRTVLSQFVALCDIRDDAGNPFPLTQTHRWRHTKATKLINGGVPLHVVQRYMGHVTPEMTMYYAQTLDATAKSEFLKYRKLTNTGEPVVISGDDLYDLMALERRTDRVLPNGWCALPPTKSCEKGNACLTCDVFVTDESFRATHEAEAVHLGSLIEYRQQSHKERTGAEMSEDHVWLRQRRLEAAALQGILSAIDSEQATGRGNPVQGAGVASRVNYDQAGNTGIGL